MAFDDSSCLYYSGALTAFWVLRIILTGGACFQTYMNVCFQTTAVPGLVCRLQAAGPHSTKLRYSAATKRVLVGGGWGLRTVML